MKFNASFITCQCENGVAMLGFADDEFNTAQYLLLQRSLESGQQDRDLGHDRVYIELSSQVKSAYGKVEEAQLEEQRIVFRFDQPTAAVVSDGDLVEVTFDVGLAKLNEIANQLHLLIGQENVTRPGG